MQTRLRERRTTSGLTQRALAERIGISRQSLVNIERGVHTPSTRIALQLSRALCCTVEDLFTLRPPSPVASRGASGRVVLAEVAGRWVAHAAGTHAADALSTEAGLTLLDPTLDLSNTVLLAGCAPPLGLLQHRTDPRAARVRWLPTSSGTALELLAKNEVHIAGLHLFDRTSQTFNLEAVQARMPDRQLELISLVRWRQGLAVAADNPFGVRSPSDLRTELRVARRPDGAGATELLRRHTDARSLGRGPVVPTHEAAAQAVAWGAADAAITLEATAHAHGLTFLPLAEERFDLVYDPATMSSATQRVLDAMVGAPFRTEVGSTGFYDTTVLGESVA